MSTTIDHPGADWAGSAGGYVCLHCGGWVTDAEWGARLQSPTPEPGQVEEPLFVEPPAQPEPKPRKPKAIPAPAAKPKAKKKA